MKQYRIIRLSIVGLLLFSCAAQATYENQISQAIQWLTSQQNSDGSWGQIDTEKFISTAEAVSALQASGHRRDAYYRGITWLENRATDNLDHQARRLINLTAHGDRVEEAFVLNLEIAQDDNQPGRSGWGIGRQYLQAPIDTALALNGLQAIDGNALANPLSLQASLNYLSAAQLGNQGWGLGPSATVDAVSTALITQSLSAWQSQNQQLTSNINNALNYLRTNVASNAPIYLQALAAQAALANDAAQPLDWLNQLHLTQAPDGSWSNGSLYDTALALHALASADGLDSQSNQTSVSIPDARLRAAINAALGRSALDQLTRGELAQLTSLTANGLSISDLTGLEWAINLVYLDVRDNRIDSTQAIDGLPNNPVVLLEGNPITPSHLLFDEDIPTVPQWGLILMAGLLIWQNLGNRRKQAKRPKPEQLSPAF